MEFVIELPVSQFEKLREIATQIGVLPEYLAKAAISDLISVGDEDFHSAADYVIRKNEELYRRLS
ncbi:MAG: hypothetical protein WCG34_08220 [Leptolinea sp.]